MKRTLTTVPPAVLGVAALGLALAACGSSATTASSAPPAAAPTSAAAGGSGSGASSQSADALTTSSTSLGTIVVGAGNRTVYMYGADKQGATTSACTGACLTAWPPVETTGKPVVKGVTGKVGTIAAPDGGRQVTLNGWPLYYFSGDSAAGDTAGQGSDGIWWVLSPAGAKITGSGKGASGTAASGYGSAVETRRGADDPANHDKGDDHGRDGANHDKGDDHGHHRRGDDHGHHGRHGADDGVRAPRGSMGTHW
jgi:predicted lipoprotein with Yx(FWY)xxD motif